MKQVFLTILIVALIASNVYAITQEELEGAKVKLNQIRRGISQMRSYINFALRGKVEEIEFTADQKQQLIDTYIAKKAEVQTLYQELP